MRFALAGIDAPRALHRATRRASAAAACACGDGGSDLELLGWSRDGRELLLRHEERRAGERHVRLEIYPVGAGPAARAPAARDERHGDARAGARRAPPVELRL